MNCTKLFVSISFAFLLCFSSCSDLPRSPWESTEHGEISLQDQILSLRAGDQFDPSKYYFNDRSSPYHCVIMYSGNLYIKYRLVNVVSTSQFGYEIEMFDSKITNIRVLTYADWVNTPR